MAYENPKCLVINLKGSDERLALVAADLKAAGLDWERIDAVDGRIKPVEDWPNYREKTTIIRHDRPLGGGEIGCGLSHQRALQYIVDHELPYALILEDDMSVPNNISAYLEDVLTYLEVDPGWHCVHMDAAVKDFQISRATVQDAELRQTFFVPCKTGAMLWSLEGAKSYLASRYVTYIMGPVDRDQRSHLARTGRGYSVLPNPIEARAGIASDIDAVDNRWATNSGSQKASVRCRILRHFPDYFHAWRHLWATRMRDLFS